MSQEPLSFLFHTSDYLKSQKIATWVSRWHGADYDPSEIEHLKNEWPRDVSLPELMQPLQKAFEEESPKALAALALKLISLLERNRLDTAQAQGAFSMACMNLCERGIPFEETAKGNEAALRFHLLAISEFGDPENVGYSTDLSELRLLARYLIDPQEVLEEFLTGDFPKAYNEAAVNVARFLADKDMAPLLESTLRRCEDSQSTATVLFALGRAGDEGVTDTLAGYALSTNQEVSTAAILALEEIGGDQALAVLTQVESLLPEEPTFLGAHIYFALVHLREGEDALRATLTRMAVNPDAPTLHRLCSLERLSGSGDEEVLTAVAGLLDETSNGKLAITGIGEDDIYYSVRDAAYLALLDCRISRLVDVLGEDILDRLEVYQSLPF